MHMLTRLLIWWHRMWLWYHKAMLENYTVDGKYRAVLDKERLRELRDRHWSRKEYHEARLFTLEPKSWDEVEEKY